MKTLASNMLSKASSMVQATKINVLGSMAKAKSMSPSNDASSKNPPCDGAAAGDVNDDPK